MITPNFVRNIMDLGSPTGFLKLLWWHRKYAYFREAYEIDSSFQGIYITPSRKKVRVGRRNSKMSPFLGSGQPSQPSPNGANPQNVSARRVMYLEDHARAGDKTFHPDQAPDDPVKSNFSEPNSTFSPIFLAVASCHQLSPVTGDNW